MMIVSRKYQELIARVESHCSPAGEADLHGALLTTLDVGFDAREQAEELKQRLFLFGAWSLAEFNAHHLINEWMPESFPPLMWAIWRPDLTDPEPSAAADTLEGLDLPARVQALARTVAPPANDDGSPQWTKPSAYPLIVPRAYVSRLRAFARRYGLTSEQALACVLELGLSKILCILTCSRMEHAGELELLPDGTYRPVLPPDLH